MDFRGKMQRRMAYPSFSLVVHRHIFRRALRPPRRRLAWTSVTSLQPHPMPARPERNDDWAMTTFDHRDGEELCSSISMYPFTIDPPMLDQTEPEPVRLGPVDDDGISEVSELELGGEGARYDGEQPGRAKRPPKGVRMFFTCKSFLEHCIRSLLKRRGENN